LISGAVKRLFVTVKYVFTAIILFSEQLMNVSGIFPTWASIELITLALASLNGMMYFFWWDKPLGVNEPVKLYRDGHEPPKKFLGEAGSEHDVSIAIL